MNTSGTQPLSSRRVALQLAAAILIFLVAATVPYSWLIAHFGYDDILREPTADILTKFHKGGPDLVIAWFGFAMSSLFFIPVVRGFKGLLELHWKNDAGASVFGISSAIAQAIGLLRWVLVVPGIAAAYMHPETSASTREALVVVFDAVHRYGGTVLGEMIGQLLLAGWTGLISVQLFRSKAVPRWIASIGLLTLPFWVVGQSEILHAVVPAIPSVEVIPIAFMAWEAWLLLIAIALIVSTFTGGAKGMHHHS